MKKSTILRIIGIILIIVAFVADAFVSGIIDMSNWDDPVINISVIAGVAALLIAGIVVIVVSRKVAKKENNKQQ